MIQTTPYIGHPAYKAMGGRAAYTLATAIFIVTSVFVAFPIARGHVKGAGALLTLYVVALFLPPALIPQFQLILNIGLYNTRIGYIMLFLVNAIGMIIVVKDPGSGFDPTDLPNPVVGENLYSEGGRGIFLINRLMDEVRFRDRGTEIWMRKS